MEVWSKREGTMEESAIRFRVNLLQPIDENHV